jgi:membrane-bound ClpP family serine protease
MNLWNRLFTRRPLAPHLMGTEDKMPESLSETMIGKLGRTLTPLRASGIIVVEGQEYEAFAFQGSVPENCLVRIVGKRMSWWLVERVE